MSAALVLAGGPESAVVAAVLIYRALTYLLQVVLGVVSYGVWRTLVRRQDDGVPEGTPSDRAGWALTDGFGAGNGVVRMYASTGRVSRRR